MVLLGHRVLSGIMSTKGLSVGYYGDQTVYLGPLPEKYNSTTVLYWLWSV